MNLIDDLNWRYATKRYTNKKVEPPDFEIILESIRLSATSLGIQPFHCFVIENPKIREELKAAAYNQPQLTEASHIIIFAAWKQFKINYVEDYLQLIAETRGIGVESLAGFRSMMLEFLEPLSDAAVLQWAAKQCYIALGKAMATAAHSKIDTTPMEGFNSGAVDTILGLDALGLCSTLILAVGYRDVENDKLAILPKVRKSAQQLFTKI